MAYTKIQFTIFESGGSVTPASGAVCTITDKETGLLAVTYSGRNGGASLGNPIVTGADGLLSFYADASRFDIDIVHTSGTQSFDDYLAPDDQIIVGPKSRLEFDTLADAIAGNASNNLDREVDWGDVTASGTLTPEISVKYNNLTSKAGGSPYIVKTLAQAATDGDVIDGNGVVGGNHALDGTYCIIINPSSNILDAYQFGCIGDNLESDPISGSDDTESMQLAIDYVIEKKSRLMVSSGRFSVSGLTAVGDDFEIYGQGEGCSIISQRVGGINPLVVTGNRVRISGIEIDGNGLGNFGVGPNTVTMTNGDVGILVGASSDLVIENCAVHDCTNLGIGVRTPTSPSKTSRVSIKKNHVYAIGERKSGVGIGGAGGNCIAVGDTAFKNPPTIIKPLVKDNICHNSHSTLISMGSCDDFRCEDNLCFDSDSNGIQVGTATRNGIICGNIIRDLTGFGPPDVENRGISVDPSTTVEKQITIQDNHIKGSQLYGIDVRVPGMIVQGNIIIDNGVNYAGATPDGLGGIAVFTGSAVVVGNHIVNSVGNGILCFVNNSNLSSMIISNNRCQSSGETGIAFNRAFSGIGFFDQPVIKGNIVDGTANGSGISLAYCNRATVEGNLSKNTSSQGFNLVASTTECLFSGNSAIGSGANDVYLDASSSVKLSLHNEYTTSTFLGTVLQPPNPVPTTSYVVSSLPSASTFNGHIIIVANEVGGRTLATSDGTNWRRVSDGAIVS